jgi:hypothetical protein
MDLNGDGRDEIVEINGTIYDWDDDNNLNQVFQSYFLYLPMVR